MGSSYTPLPLLLEALTPPSWQECWQLSQLRPSLGIALSCLTQGHNLPWGLSTSNAYSVGGGIKPGREGVGAQLYGVPLRND